MAEMRYSRGPNVPQYNTASVQKVGLGGSRPMQSPTRGKSTVIISSRKWRALRGRGTRGASGVLLGVEAQKKKVRVHSGRARGPSREWTALQCALARGQRG